METLDAQNSFFPGYLCLVVFLMPLPACLRVKFSILMSCKLVASIVKISILNCASLNILRFILLGNGLRSKMESVRCRRIVKNLLLNFTIYISRGPRFIFILELYNWEHLSCFCVEMSTVSSLCIINCKFTLAGWCWWLWFSGCRCNA